MHLTKSGLFIYSIGPREEDGCCSQKGHHQAQERLSTEKDRHQENCSQKGRGYQGENGSVTQEEENGRIY